MHNTKKLIAAMLCVALIFAFGCPIAFAANAAQPDEPESLSYSHVALLLNGEPIGSGLLVDDTTLVPLRAFVEALLGSPCEAAWDQDDSSVSLTAEGLSLSMTLGDEYMVVNGRYLYVGDQAMNVSGTIVVPIRVLTKIFGVEVTWDPESWCASMVMETPNILESGDTFYNADDLYWMSHVIFSEAGNQPLDGMIGVGNVVLNRVADENGWFADGIRGVIFQYGQFDVISGAIYREPTELAIIAAKLCLDGANVVGSSLWFVNPNIGSTRWFRENATFYCTIADHDFYA